MIMRSCGFPNVSWIRLAVLSVRVWNRPRRGALGPLRAWKKKLRVEVHPPGIYVHLST